MRFDLQFDRLAPEMDLIGIMPVQNRSFSTKPPRRQTSKTSLFSPIEASLRSLPQLAQLPGEEAFHCTLRSGQQERGDGIVLPLLVAFLKSKVASYR